MIPPTKDELMAFIPKMNEANQEAMRMLLADSEFKALSENEQAEASIQALLFAYFTEQRFKDEADEADEDKGLLRQKPAGEFEIGEKAVFGMQYLGDDDRVQYPDGKILIKKGTKWAHWGYKNGTKFIITKKTPIDEMLTYCPY